MVSRTGNEMRRSELGTDSNGGGTSVPRLPIAAQSPVAHGDLVPKLSVVLLIAFGALAYWLFV